MYVLQVVGMHIRRFDFYDAGDTAIFTLRRVMYFLTEIRA